MEILQAKKIIKEYGNMYFVGMTKHELADIITAMQTIGFHNGNLTKVCNFSQAEITKISKSDLINIAQISKQFMGEIPWMK